MALYKYCNEAGKYIFQNLEIKATPANELNDVCEMRPVVKNSDPMAWAERFLTKTLADPSYFMKNAGLFRGKTFTEFQVFANSHRDDLLVQLAKASPKLDEHLQKEFVDILSAKWGVVSLSDRPLEHKMWALYADAHKGLLVEFDQTNGLFNNPSCVKCEYCDIPVVYDVLPEGNHAAI